MTEKNAGIWNVTLYYLFCLVSLKSVL